MRDKKVLFVTGASSDIGINLIVKVALDYEVILAHYCSSSEKLEETNEVIGGKLVLIQADFSDTESVAKMIQQINELGYEPDHIVHLASPKIEILKFYKDNWNSFNYGIETSIHSIVDILRSFVPFMMKNKYGKIVFMLSSVTLNQPTKYQSSYIVTKYALLGLMKSLSKEYADKGIMVNGVSPDMIETKFLSNIPNLIIEKNAADSPLGRNLTIDDVIPTFQFLLSEGADTITGQNIGITGGI